MDITWLGHSSFRIKGKSVTVVTDPYSSSKLGFKFQKIEANIVTVSHDHDDHNQAGQVDGDPKVVKNPGEYEVKGVSIFGIPTYHDNKQGEERGQNTVFVIKIDSIIICHLGDLGHKLTEDQVGQIGNIDILMVPVGGNYTIDAEAAALVVASLEPKVVIPMHYNIPGMAPQLAEKLAPVEDFVKEMGIEPVKDTKYSVMSDKLPTEVQVVVLERRS